MWSVGISVSPCEDAERMGYDNRQINRIVIRMSQYFIHQDMRVIFGHDWREDGVMSAIADFACKVAVDSTDFEQKTESLVSKDLDSSRLLNIVPTGRDSFSRMVRDAVRDSGGVLEVLSITEDRERLRALTTDSEQLWQQAYDIKDREAELTMLRRWLTALLNPGCRICLGGRLKNFQGREPGVMEEARWAMKLEKPLFLLGGFGGATFRFGNDDKYGSSQYWKARNGLKKIDKQELFNTTDIERALRIISFGISRLRQAKT